jgi:EF-hand domain-containing protein 1
VYDCDAFTRDYYTQHLGVDVGKTIELPKDEYTLTRDQITRVCGGDHGRFYGKVRYPLKTYMEASLGNPIRSRLQSEKKRKFLANNRKVLCFYCEYDDREKLYGDLMLYTLNYFLEDDTIEIKEVIKQNSGRDPFPLLLKRGRLLKNWKSSLLDEQDRGVEEPASRESYYNEEDLGVGKTITVFGRAMRLVDADPFTRDYFQLAWGLELAEPMATAIERPVFPKPEPPPYTGYGTEEDSLGSCMLLVPKPPKKDFIKMAKFDRMLLRFLARMISSRKEQAQRRFVITYFLSDDTAAIYEPEQRNSGVVNGKFLERGAFKKPDGSRYLMDDFAVGSELVVNGFRFEIIDCDEYTRKFMAS